MFKYRLLITHTNGLREHVTVTANTNEQAIRFGYRWYPDAATIEVL